MNTKLGQGLVLATALLAGCAGTAQQRAAAEPESAPARTQYADQDRDGKVSRDEAAVDKYLAAEFDNLDLDKDGMLSTVEFERLSARRANRRGATPAADYSDGQASGSSGQSLNRAGR